MYDVIKHVKCDIGKILFYKLPLYYEIIHVLVLSLHITSIWHDLFFFLHEIKIIIYGFDLYVANVPHSYVPVLQCNEAQH